MQKQIKLHEYFDSMTKALNECCYNTVINGIPKTIINSQAFMFFLIFGKEVSQNLVNLAKEKDENITEENEYYKVLSSLNKNMNTYNANLFITYLEDYLSNS